MRQLVVGIVALGLVTACGDGVPNVEDPHNPVVNGKAMTPRAFLEKYCAPLSLAEKAASRPCTTVDRAMSMDATKGKQPKGW